jgi:hypothetical protein
MVLFDTKAPVEVGPDEAAVLSDTRDRLVLAVEVEAAPIEDQIARVGDLVVEVRDDLAAVQFEIAGDGVDAAGLLSSTKRSSLFDPGIKMTLPV